MTPPPPHPESGPAAMGYATRYMLCFTDIITVLKYTFCIIIIIPDHLPFSV